MAKFFIASLAVVALSSIAFAEEDRSKRGFEDSGFEGSFGGFEESFDSFGNDELAAGHAYSVSNFHQNVKSIGGKGVSVSASSIARTAADQAHGAIEKQSLAAGQATYQAKSAHAETANQAAQTAQAALAGKQTLVNVLHQIAQDAQSLISSEVAQLEQAKRAAWASHNAAQQAKNQIALLSSSIATAQDILSAAEKAVVATQQEVGAQEKMIQTAKLRAQQASNQFQAALSDLQTTQAEADRAANFAAKATANAAHIAQQIVAEGVAKSNNVHHHH